MARKLVCLSLLAFCLLQAGCSLLPAKPEPIAVNIPVPVPCVTELPAAPTLPSDDEYRAMDEYRFVTSLWLERRLRQNYQGELEAILKGCR